MASNPFFKSSFSVGLSMKNSSTITEIWWWNLDKELSDSLDKVIDSAGVGSFDVVGVDFLDDVDTEGLVVVIN